MSERALVSVVTATYDMAHYLVEAVDSILAQDHPAIEAIVVDDGSTDDTPAVLERYADDVRVKIVRQENAGQTVAKNRGLAEATGEFVGFCDADNAWLPDKISTQVAAFADRPDTGVVYGDIQFIDDEGRDLPTPAVERPSGRITGPLLANNFVPFNTCLVPRRILEEVGGFDESLSMAIDYDLWLRISVKYEFLHLPRVLARYRIWGGQMSHRTGERLDNALRMMTNFIERHPDAVTPAEVNRAWAYTLTTRGQWHAREGRRERAMTDYQAAIGRNFTDRRAWKSLVKLILGEDLMDFRLYEPADLGGCLDLIRTGHDPDFSEARFRWLHEQAPWGSSKIALAVEGGRIVGIYSVIPKKVVLDDREFMGGRDVDPVVHPSCRGQGVFSRLLQFGLENFEGIDFYFNFANPASARGFLANGWQKTLTLGDAVFQLGYGKLLSKEFLIWLVTGSRIRHGTHPGKELHSEEAAQLLEDPARLQGPQLPLRHLGVERSVDYLKWRYLSHPFHNYRWFLAERGPKSWELAVIKGEKTDKYLTVVDFSSAGSTPTLDDWPKLLLETNPQSVVKTWTSVPSRSRRAFFVHPNPKGTRPCLLVRTPEASDEIEDICLSGSWFLTPGDLEIS